MVAPYPDGEQEPYFHPEPLPQPQRHKVNTKWLIGLSMLTLLVPVFMLFVVFPWLEEPAFQSVDEINPADVEVLRVQLFNHPQGKDDVGPVEMSSDDFPILLAALSRAEKVDKIPPKTLFGEYRVRFKDSRRGTIRLYWQKANPNQADSAVIWIVIGRNKYRAGGVLELYKLAGECATRGKLQR